MGECVFKRDIKPWHQLPCESDEAYRTFCLFLNMGRQRSLNKFVIMINKMTTYEQPLFVDQLGLRSYIFAWTKRAKLCERFIQDVLLMGDTHTRGDCMLQQKAKLLTGTPKTGKKNRTDCLAEKTNQYQLR